MKSQRKRFAAMLTAAIAAVSMCHAFPASAAEKVNLMGDMDGDLKITANDAQMALNYYAESIVENIDDAVTDETENADIDMNGIIDVTDAQSILSYFCQTLVGEQPLWAEYRELSYHDGTDADTIGNKPFALRSLYVEIGCAQGAPGETVTVPVYLAGARALAGFGFRVIPPAGLTPVDITSDIDTDYAFEDADFNLPPVKVVNKGAFAWIRVNNADIRNGYVLANYTYTIPEDAQSGDVYQICLDTSSASFIADTSSEDAGSYQYTLLNGVVVVS